ncbi:PA3496 family putative envelope integrity protein [Thaumasiovibrio subtropicus]|nr:hypothetical protein [Thaumasiovibrio subtropicus]
MAQGRIEKEDSAPKTAKQREAEARRRIEEYFEKKALEKELEYF